MSREILDIHDINIENEKLGGLKHVSFRIFEGEVLGLFGLDRSGTELIRRILSGENEYFPGKMGSIYLYGKKVTAPSELRKVVSYIPMATSVLENWTLAEYMELVKSGSFISNSRKKQMEQKTAELFGKFGLVTDPKRTMGSLDELERRVARVMRSITDGAKILIIEDECLGMEHGQIEHYVSVLHQVVDKGYTVIFKCQSLKLSEMVCRAGLVFRKGRLVKRWREKDTLKWPSIRSYLLGNTVTGRMKRLEKTKRSAMSYRNVLYEVRNLWFAGKRYDLKFYEGEIVTFVINNNERCREFFDRISGRKPHKNIGYYHRGSQMKRPDIRKFVRSRIVSTVMGNEEYELFRNMSLEDNLLIPSLMKFSGAGYFAENSNLHKAVRGTVKDENGTDLDSDLRIVDQNGRIRIDMEKWYMFKPDVLIMYEPFSACDAYGASVIESYIKKFTNIGTSVIVVKTSQEYMSEISDQLINVEI